MPGRNAISDRDPVRRDADAGIYALVLYLPRARGVGAGRLGRRRLAAGWYVYVGSAKRNLVARLARHLRRAKGPHWHIDHLRALAGVKEIWIWPWTHGGECRTNDRIQECSGASVPWTGFGSSDCRCASHLTRFVQKPAACFGDAPTPLVVNPGRLRLPRARGLTLDVKGRILYRARQSGAAKEPP